MTEEQKKKNNKRMNEWKKANRERINFLMPQGYKNRINAAAAVLGISASEFIRRAIDEKIKRDGLPDRSEQ